MNRLILFSKLRDVFSFNISQCLKVKSMRVSSDGIRIRDMVIEYEPHKKAQTHSSGLGQW